MDKNNAGLLSPEGLKMQGGSAENCMKNNKSVLGCLKGGLEKFRELC